MWLNYERVVPRIFYPPLKRWNPLADVFSKNKPCTYIARPLGRTPVAGEQEPSQSVVEKFVTVEKIQYTTVSLQHIRSGRTSQTKNKMDTDHTKYANSLVTVTERALDNPGGEYPWHLAVALHFLLLENFVDARKRARYARQAATTSPHNGV